MIQVGALEHEKSEDHNQSNDMFGDLHEWKRSVFPTATITSLLVSDDMYFSSEDLSTICLLTPLKQLFLHNLPNLDSLPPNLVRLTYLKVLSVTHCSSLTSLSLGLRYLSNLETLRLNCPSIHNLPSFLCLMSSLNLLLLQKPVAICGQCKDHIRKSPRVIITYHQELSTNPMPLSVLPLTVLAANILLSTFTSSFYSIIPIKMLWPFFDEVINLPHRRCCICLSTSPTQSRISINCTRLFDCKCVHLHGFVCSQRCKGRLIQHISLKCPNADVLVLSQSLISLSPRDFVRPIPISLWRRVKKAFNKWASCIPRYHKSYTVTAI